MGAKNDWSSLRGRFAGKWQVPLLAIALALFSGTIHCTRQEVPVVPFKEALAAFDEQISAKLFSEAIRQGRELSAHADVTAPQWAQVELGLGRARLDEAL